MLKKACLIFSLLVLFFLLPLKAYAVSVIINDPPTTIGSDQFQLSVTVTGASAGTNYLRVDLYKDGTTNYFGETFNGNDWYGGSIGAQYLPIAIPSDSPFIVQARIGDTIPGDYTGTGEYKLRVRRYTASGNYNNDEAKASAISIALVLPTPTLVPTNTPTPTKIPTPTHTPTPTHSASSGQAKVPTLLPTKSLTATITKIPTLTPTKIVPVKNQVISSSSASPTAILGASASADPRHPSPKPLVLVKSAEQTNLFMGFAIIVGSLCMMGAGGYIFWQRMKYQQEE